MTKIHVKVHGLLGLKFGDDPYSSRQDLGTIALQFAVMLLIFGPIYLILEKYSLRIGSTEKLHCTKTSTCCLIFGTKYQLAGCS